MLRLLILLACPLLAAQEKKADFLAGPALTYADLQKAVGVVFDGRLKQAVEKRGINGAVTDAQLAQLRAAGASPALLDAIRAKARPEPSPAPNASTRPTSRLTLQCAPAECEVLLNGKPVGSTREGMLELAGLTPGEAIVDFRRPGYLTEQIVVSLEPNTARVRAIRLTPDVETMRKAGRELFRKLTERMASTPEPTPLTMTGTAILWTEGKRSDWQLTGAVQPAAQSAFLEIQGAGLKWRATVKGAVVKSDGSRKLKGDAVAMEMEKLVRIFSSCQPAELMKRFSAPGTAYLAMEARPDERNRQLKVQNGSETALIIVAPDGTPLRIDTDGWELTWADFERLDSGLYPRTFSVRAAAANSAANELRLDKVVAPEKR